MGLGRQLPITLPEEGITIEDERRGRVKEICIAFWSLIPRMPWVELGGTHKDHPNPGSTMDHPRFKPYVWVPKHSLKTNRFEAILPGQISPVAQLSSQLLPLSPKRGLPCPALRYILTWAFPYNPKDEPNTYLSRRCLLDTVPNFSLGHLNKK